MYVEGTTLAGMSSNVHQPRDNIKVSRCSLFYKYTDTGYFAAWSATDLSWIKPLACLMIRVSGSHPLTYRIRSQPPLRTLSD